MIKWNLSGNEQSQGQVQQPVQMQMNFSQGQLQNGYEVHSQAVQQPVQQPAQQPVQQTEMVQPPFDGGMEAYYDSIQSNMIPDEGEMLGASNIVSQVQTQQPVGYYENYQNGGYQNGYQSQAQPQYVNEPSYYPTKLLGKFTMKGKQLSTGLEFLTDGFNLGAYAKNQDGSQGRLISFDSKMHLNFWTYDAQNHQVDFAPVYCDLSKFAALAIMVQNGSIFNLTEDYKRRKAQADVQAQNGGQRIYVPSFWESLGGSSKSTRYTVNRKQLNLPCVSTKLTLEPAQKPNCWLLKVTISEGIKGQNGAIAPSKFIKTLFFTLDYVQLCEISAFTLAAVNANVSSIMTKRLLARKEG